MRAIRLTVIPRHIVIGNLDSDNQKGGASRPFLFYPFDIIKKKYNNADSAS